jgi:hypothetical protein
MRFGVPRQFEACPYPLEANFDSFSDAFNSVFIVAMTKVGCAHRIVCNGRLQSAHVLHTSDPVRLPSYPDRNVRVEALLSIPSRYRAHVSRTLCTSTLDPKP